uniref:Uncharacterized protein n=1 Tax=Opuntia streptacantha TaxID=393608 RepID=A0A7C8YK05_OPUST
MRTRPRGSATSFASVGNAARGNLIFLADIQFDKLSNATLISLVNVPTSSLYDSTGCLPRSSFRACNMSSSLSTMNFCKPFSCVLLQDASFVFPDLKYSLSPSMSPSISVPRAPIFVWVFPQQL